MTAPEVGQPLAPRATALEHCGRVRFLARQGWLDAIQIDVGVPSLGYSGPEWPVTDGNHRLWASILRGEAFIAVDICGQIDQAAMLLGVPEALIMGCQADPQSA